MALLPIIAGIGTALGAIGARKAAKTQAGAARDAANAQLTATRESNAMLRDFRKEDIARFSPFYNSGLGAQNALAYEMGVGSRPKGYQGFTGTPGYDFRRQQGLDAVQSSVAARQGLLSGAALKGMEQFGQDYASNEYGNYLARLGSMASSGQNAAGMQGAASQNYGGQIGANTIAGGQAAAQGFANAGNAAAAGTVGMANAFSGGINNALGAWQYGQMLDRFAPVPGTPTASPVTNAFSSGAAVPSNPFRIGMPMGGR